MRTRGGPLASAAWVVLVLTAGAASADLDDARLHRFTIISQDVADVLDEFASSAGVFLNVDPKVRGRVTNFRHRVTARGFLDRLAAEQGLAWYYDGDTLHVTPADANRSVFLDFQEVTPAMLEETLASLAVEDDRFAVRITGSEGIGVVTGPPRYIELVEHAFTLLQSKIARDGGERAPGRRSIVVVRGGAVQLWRGHTASRPADPAEMADASAAPAAADEASKDARAASP